MTKMVDRRVNNMTLAFKDQPAPQIDSEKEFEEFR